MPRIDKPRYERDVRDDDQGERVTPVGSGEPEPVWIGWVLRAHPDGYMRQKVVLPQSVIDAWAQGAPHPPDLRSNVVAQMTRDLMSDALLTELHRKDG